MAKRETIAMENECILIPKVAWRDTIELIKGIKESRIILWNKAMSGINEIGEIYKEIKSTGSKLAVEDEIHGTTHIKERWEEVGKFKYYTNEIEEERIIITKEIITPSIYAFYQCQGFDTVVKKGEIMRREKYYNLYEGTIAYAEW